MPPAKAIGELAVVALKARNLPDREIVGKQDPFCVFRLGDQAKKTKTDHRGGQHPLWDDQVNLVVPEGKTKMIVQLFDEDKRKEDLISEGEIDLATVLKNGEQDEWFDLQYKGRPAGQIYLELTFYSASAPPRPTNQPVRMEGHVAHQGMMQQRYGQHPGPQQQRPIPPPKQPQQNIPPVGPAPYRPPPDQHQQGNQMARPHVPPPLNGPGPTSSSSSAPLYPPNRPPAQRHSPPGGFVNRPPPQTYPSHPTGPLSHSPPDAYNRPPYPPPSSQQPPGAYPPQQHHQPPPPHHQQSTSLLTSAYNPQNRPPPQNSQPHYPPSPQGVFTGGFQQPPPQPSQHRPPYPPQGGGGMAFPEPQHYSNYQPSFDEHGQPFAAHGSPFPSPAQQRPMPGYPPYPPR